MYIIMNMKYLASRNDRVTVEFIEADWPYGMVTADKLISSTSGGLLRE